MVAITCASPASALFGNAKALITHKPTINIKNTPFLPIINLLKRFEI
jgi:hypothetical protein